MGESAALALYRQILKMRRVEGDAALCAALDMLAGDTGENKYRHAGNVLRGARAGRQRINDAREIREILELEKRGKSRGAAVSIVAQDHASPDVTAESLAHRYRGRLRKISGQNGSVRT